MRDRAWGAQEHRGPASPPPTARCAMLGGGWGLSPFDWAEARGPGTPNTPGQRPVTSRPPVPPGPNSSPASPGDGDLEELSIGLGALGSHELCRRRNRPGTRKLAAPHVSVLPAPPTHVHSARPHVLPSQPAPDPLRVCLTAPLPRLRTRLAACCTLLLAGLACVPQSSPQGEGARKW